MRPIHRILIALVLGLLAASMATGSSPRRRATPLTTAATTTQAVNQTASDSSRVRARRLAQSTSYVDEEKGYTVFVDTITGDKWLMDSTVLHRVPKMEFPLLHAITVGVNIFEPVMRAFGQDYGLADAWVELSLHNRYKPIFEVGLGSAHHKPSDMNFTYSSPVSPFFRIGANYNFLYNSNPDYSFYAGLRYGISPFSYKVTDVTISSDYWGESSTFGIPSQHTTVGWLEVVAGVRVKIWGPVSAGWSFKYQTLMHQSAPKYGKPWYIPGYGARGNSIGATFSVSYTFGFPNKHTGSRVIEETTDTIH